MSNSFVFSKNLPINSIINPDVLEQDYLDYNNPFSFFDFLKNVKESLTPLQFNDSYVNYIKLWNEKKSIINVQINETIRDRYIELIQEITLKYLTLDEKRFLSNINYEDETELDIILPFYSKKISDICNFYIEKRENAKYKIEKNKIKGTNNSLKKSLYETITDVVFSDSLDISLYQTNIDYEELLSNLDIEIEELYDLYTSYFDNDFNESYKTYDVKTELRQQLYTSNKNDVEANIFLNFDEAVKGELLNNIRIFLTEFGRIFTVNYNIADIDLNCKPDEKLYNLVNDNKPTANRLVQLKYDLIRKYIGCDFHYIITGTTITDVTSAVLFKSINPTGNLLNRHFPTTATVEEESELYSCRRIGLFFTPEKNSILYYSVPEKRYIIDNSKLEPNKLYIFPDPEIYGNTSGLKRTYNSEYPLIHICDYSKSIKNYSNFVVEGDINSNPYDQDFYAYYSRNQINDSLNYGKSGLITNFSQIYNKGIVTRWSNDIYGNQFALFKNKPKLKLVDNTINVSESTNICEFYDGGPIKFYENEFLPEPIFTGNKEWVKPNIWASNYYYNLLIEGGVGGFFNGKIIERGLYPTEYIVDGLMLNETQRNILSATFDINFNVLYKNDLNIIDGLQYTSDTFEWDLNTQTDTLTVLTANYIIDALYFNRDGKFYNTGYNNLNPKPNNTLDGNTVSDDDNEYKANYNKYYSLSSIKNKEFDGGLLSEECDDTFDFETQTNFIIKEISNIYKTITSTNFTENDVNPYELRNNYGEIYVKNVATNEISHLSSALKDQFESKYTSISSEIINEVVDFNVFNDFLYIKTTNHIIFEKIKFENNKFVYSGTSDNYLKLNSNSSTEIYNTSNVFIFENRDYALIMCLSGGNIKSNSFYIIPILYKIDYFTNKITQIEINADYTKYTNNVNKNPIKLCKIKTPYLTYNSRNNKYGVLAIIEDSNEYPYLYQLKFDFKGDKIVNDEIKLYTLLENGVYETINFYDTPSLSSSDIDLNNILNVTNVVINQSEGEIIFN